ncbi:hypothetical protein [Micromonospora echinofusca]|uniref:Uncharacterized protein n=1 Tax=Micromonospora echinofusca TaxID=47858 RepID=A0ABS3VXK5_MICEH|nr:hypothetical protein [Micromonospora echinofusca]MBO4209173.1 hypothetical protein [Micromonospora echinofusca]
MSTDSGWSDYLSTETTAVDHRRRQLRRRQRVRHDGRVVPRRRRGRERLQERTRRTRDLASSIGAVITPYVLAGRLVQMNSRNPAVRLSPLSGVDADETAVTFCQRCGDRRSETALRTCPPAGSTSVRC